MRKERPKCREICDEIKWAVSFTSPETASVCLESSKIQREIMLLHKTMHNVTTDIFLVIVSVVLEIKCN